MFLKYTILHFLIKKKEREESERNVEKVKPFENCEIQIWPRKSKFISHFPCSRHITVEGGKNKSSQKTSV